MRVSSASMSYLAHIKGVRRGIACIVMLGAVCVCDALATPETWIVPSISLEGTASNARFGDAIACSKANATNTYRSYVAVGAPNENGGQGRVHIFDPGDSVNPIMSIPSPNISPLGFGSSVAFITDQNSDGIDDLAVGEPGTGSVYIYTSMISGSALSYSLCNTVQVSASYGATLLGLRGPFQPGAYPERLVVANPDSGTVHGLDLSAGCGSAATFGSRFTVINGNGRLGASLAELPDSALGDGDLQTDVIAGQPEYSIGSSGQVFLLDSNENESVFSTVSEEQYGTALGGSYLSDIFAVGSPYRNSGRGGISVYQGSTLVCNAAVPALESSSLFGFSLAHLNTSFQNLFSGGSAATFATNRSESTTGGSVAVFALVAEGSCDTMKQVNNCIADAAQEQGKVIVGGANCLINPSGTPKPLMIFSSPGWNSNKGRVDIVVEGNELAIPSPCGGTPTVTPTATPTMTPTVTPTFMPTDTPSASPVIPVPTPVPLSPGAAVPAPSIEVVDKLVTVIIPDSTISLTPSQSARLVKTLVSKYKLTKKKAMDIVGSPANFIVTYEITISPASGAASVFTVDVPFEMSGSASKKRQYKTRLNRISVRNLPSGGYTASYLGQIALKKPKTIMVGSTKKSAPTKFRVG